MAELAHAEQLGTWSDPGRSPGRWELATAYLGLVPTDVDPRLPSDTAWHTVDALPRLGVRPRRDRAGGPGAAAREAVVHQHRLRARALRLHAARAARPVRGGARPRRVRHQPEARAAPARTCWCLRAGVATPAAQAGGRRSSTASGRASSRSPTSSQCCARRPEQEPSPKRVRAATPNGLHAERERESRRTPVKPTREARCCGASSSPSSACSASCCPAARSPAAGTTSSTAARPVSRRRCAPRSRPARSTGTS